MISYLHKQYTHTHTHTQISLTQISSNQTKYAYTQKVPPIEKCQSAQAAIISNIGLLLLNMNLKHFFVAVEFKSREFWTMVFMWYTNMRRSICYRFCWKLPVSGVCFVSLGFFNF